MPLLLWKNQYSVQIKEFDNQHKQLFTLINNLINSVKKDEELRGVEAAVDGLVQYTEEHFSFEEMNMQKYNYPDFEAHKKEHERLTAQVIDLTDKFEKGEVDPNRLIMFLMEWLVKHIMGVDKKYSDFFKDKPISQ